MKYKLRYYWGKFLAFFGICRDCYSPVNTLPNGTKVCSNCRKRY